MLCYVHLACRFTLFILYIQQHFYFLMPIAKPMAAIASEGRLTQETMIDKIES
jgi:hypothetical protein